MKNFLLILLLISISLVSADMIYLKNGAKLEGDIIGIAADSVTIQTKGPEAKMVKIASNEIMRIEKEKGEVTIAKSVKAVGYGCLGGVIGGGIATTILVLADGFHSAELSVITVTGLVITGILIGVITGGQ